MVYLPATIRVCSEEERGVTVQFVTVDNQGDRLAALTALLKETFPDCAVTEFTDPLLSAKYILNHAVDTVLAAEFMRPADGETLRHVIQVNKPQVRVVLLDHSGGQPETQGGRVLPITREKLRAIVTE